MPSYPKTSRCIGRTENHLIVRVGPWSIYLELGSGRFPRVGDIIPSIQSAKTTLELHGADAEFFTQNASRLPGSLEERAVTFDIGNTIAVRAKTIDTQAAEITLTNSSKTGDDVAICLNRQNLVSAARMAFNRLYLYGKDNAVLAHDEHRSYLFMPLHEQNAIKASNDCLKIPSPFSSRSSASYSRPRHYIPTVPMATNHATSAPATTLSVDSTQPSQAPPLRRRRRKSGTAGTVLDQAITLRDRLRLTLASTKDLIRTLKAEKRSQKSLRLALDSLKQLQAAA